MFVFHLYNTFLLNKSQHIFVCFYFPLFASATYFSKAPVIDGVPGLGAIMSTRKPCSKASFFVVSPKTAILVLFCWKSGKFLNNYLIPVGLKNAKTS